jgi:hypothetical protein
MTNILITSCIVYYIGYSISNGFIPEGYNYMSVAVVALLDLYFSNGILQGNVESKGLKASRGREVSKKPKTGRRVTFNPYPTIHTIPARPDQDMIPVPPRYMPMQPGMMYPAHHQQQQQQQQMPMIDNRDVADEIESNESESSIDSIAVSDTISWSSEEN